MTPTTDEIIHQLTIMTALVRLKYGNLDHDVYAEIEKSEAIIAAIPVEDAE